MTGHSSGRSPWTKDEAQESIWVAQWGPGQGRDGDPETCTEEAHVVYRSNTWEVQGGGPMRATDRSHRCGPELTAGDTGNELGLGTDAQGRN